MLDGDGRGHHRPALLAIRAPGLDLDVHHRCKYFLLLDDPTCTRADLSRCSLQATVGVGLCNGTYKAVNWQRVGLLLFAWIMTIPVAGTIAGVTMGIILNAPHFAS